MVFESCAQCSKPRISCSAHSKPNSIAAVVISTGTPLRASLRNRGALQGSRLRRAGALGCAQAGFQRTDQDLATRISAWEFATRTASNSVGGPVTSTYGSHMIVLIASLAGPFL